MHHLWTGQDFGNKLPSEGFREHFRQTLGAGHRLRLGPDFTGGDG